MPLYPRSRSLSILAMSPDDWHGAPNGLTSCPLARVIRRSTGQASVVVWTDRAFVDGIPYSLPPVAAEFVRRYSRGDVVWTVPAFELIEYLPLHWQT